MGNDLIKKESELLEKFIGKNYKKIMTRSFNIPGFFFGSFYLFYRKMYLYGVGVFVLNLLINILLNNIYVGLLINILVAVLVNKIYVSFAQKKIQRIKETNKEKSEEELEKVCKEQGGTSVLGIILGFLIEFIITGIYIAIAIFLFGMNIKNFITFNVQEDTPSTEESDVFTDDSLEEDYIPGVYNGMLLYDSDTFVKEEFAMEVPSAFTDNEYDYEYNYEYENKEETEEFFKYCRLSMTAIQDFTSSEDLIRQMAIYFKNEDASNVENEMINNITWSSFSMKNDIGKTYYYATTKSNKVYLLTYEVQAGAGSKCEEYKIGILNSIKSK